jgi:hypothetical protein
MFLRDLSVYMDRNLAVEFPSAFWQRFHRESCCITEPLLHLLHCKFDCDNVAKIHLEMTTNAPAKPDRSLITEKYLAAGRPSVQACPWYFDFAAYLSETDFGKRLRLLDAVEGAITWIGKVHRWKRAPLHAAAERLRTLNCEYEYQSRTSWPSRNRQWVARVGFRFELQWVHAFAVLHRLGSKTETARQEMGVLVPEMGCTRLTARQGRWSAPGTFRFEPSGFWREKLTADFSKWTQSTADRQSMTVRSAAGPALPDRNARR